MVDHKVVVREAISWACEHERWVGEHEQASVIEFFWDILLTSMEYLGNIIWHMG
jgi:hypothetical protein